MDEIPFYKQPIIKRKQTFLDEKRGIEPLPEIKYFDYVPLLIEKGFYESELHIVTSELARMSDAMSILFRNKEKRSRKVLNGLVEEIGEYVQFLRQRQDYLSMKSKTERVFEHLFDSNGELKTPQVGIENDTEPEIAIKLNAVQKVLLLDKLGLIQALQKIQPVSTSVNAMADLIALFTGEKRATIQPYLNALLNDTAAENKNPYNSKSSLSKVENLLQSKGIQSKK